MRLRYLLAGAVLGMVIAAVGIAAAVDDDGDDGSALPTSGVDADESPYVGLSLQVAIDRAEDEGREWRIARENDQVFALTDDLVAGRVTFEVDDGIVTAAEFGPELPVDLDPDTDTPADTFIGLSEEDAAALAEEQGRAWRVSRRDAEQFALTDDLNPGRVTFEIDNGIVTAATIEQPSLPENDLVQPDAARADLIADAVRRLVTDDNSFGGRDVFAEFRVGTTVGRERPFELSALDRDFITAALSDLGEVTFIEDVDAEIETLFGTSPDGIAVVAVDDLFLLDDRAEAEMRLWCGSLCGVFLTYEAVPDDGGWLITGVKGPIAIS